ncbi:MAG: EVE domain-containing protein [Dehalococcoidia bacterium]|nr:EVE domain-containing protein [Dehalococcoidia bacterium]
MSQIAGGLGDFMARNYWMFVQTRDNFEITKSMGFKLHGLGARHRRRADRMQPNDNILYYVRETKSWLALATIRSKAFEDRSPLWNPTQRGEDFRYRVKIEPRLVLEDEEAVNALLLAPRLEYLKRWAPELWPLAFMDSVHLLPQRDFRLIEAEMKRIRSATDRRKRTERRKSGEPALDVESTGGDDLPIGALVSPAPDSQEEHSPGGHTPDDPNLSRPDERLGEDASEDRSDGKATR